MNFLSVVFCFNAKKGFSIKYQDANDSGIAITKVPMRRTGMEVEKPESLYIS